MKNPITQTQNTTPLIDSTKQTSQFRTAYSPKQRHTMSFLTHGKTKQSFKAECDINIIMGRYLKTGQIDHVNRAMPQFSNLEGIDYQESMYIVAESRSLFEQLPSEIRYQFGNDPGRFLDFVHNPDNKSEMARMGLLTPEAASLLNQATPPAAPPPASSSTPAAANPQTSGGATSPAQGV